MIVEQTTKLWMIYNFLLLSILIIFIQLNRKIWKSPTSNVNREPIHRTQSRINLFKSTSEISLPLERYNNKIHMLKIIVIISHICTKCLSLSVITIIQC